MPQGLKGIQVREPKRASGASPLGSAFVIALPMVLLMVGCASKAPSPAEPSPGSGIAEHRMAVADAQKALCRMLTSLAAVSAQSDRCSPKVVAAFSDEFQRFEVESVQLRERFQAMQARGDAYFGSWHDQMAQGQAPQRRAFLENQRPALQEHFQKIKVLSEQGREAFGSFLAGLRKLRNSLERDPASLGTQTMQETLPSTRAYGEHVDRCLVTIGRELDSMSAIMTASGPAAKNPGAR
jgi:hypothetical protein